MRESIVAFSDRINAEVRKNGAIPIWWVILESAGYPKVYVSNWINMHNEQSVATQWLDENVGWENYYRTGQEVYFTHDKDAVNFALKWA
jgi:hypothetical protein